MSSSSTVPVDPESSAAVTAVVNKEDQRRREDSTKATGGSATNSTIVVAAETASTEVAKRKSTTALPQVDENAVAATASMSNTDRNKETTATTAAEAATAVNSSTTATTDNVASSLSSPSPKNRKRQSNRRNSASRPRHPRNHLPLSAWKQGHSPMSSPWQTVEYRYSLAGATTGGASGDTSTAPWHDHMRRVGQQAAYNTKTQLWDSNETTVQAATGLVQHWEHAYQAARSGLVWGVQQTIHVYGAAKEGASSVERGLWRPLCDWVVLPTWNGAEWVVLRTATFLQSPTARAWAEICVAQVRQVPVVGPHLLAPALLGGTQLCQRTWDVLQYPIPSQHQVRSTVEATLNATKWGISTAGTHLLLFVRQADASISRALSQTQWNVLGNGPYWELAPNLRTSLLHSLADRYLELVRTRSNHEGSDSGDQDTDSTSVVARYEWMARIRYQNERLAVDLADFLVTHCATHVEDDEWLQPCPVYRHLQRSFLLPEEDSDTSDDALMSSGSSHGLRRTALWFYQPCVNGRVPSRDTPWIPLTAKEQEALEKRYIELVQGKAALAYGTFSSNLDSMGQKVNSDSDQEQEESKLDETILVSNERRKSTRKKKSVDECSTMAHWYTPNPVTDVLVDQKRHSVTLIAACQRCETSMEVQGGPPRVATPPGLCRNCRHKTTQIPWSPPPTPMACPFYTARRRPTLWRFYGDGDVVRRSVWFLEHRSAGLQPFDTAASRVLEDAYWFLQWRALQDHGESNVSNEKDGAEPPSIDAALLTVEVICPDGAARLVQFASLSEATAIHKGLGGALTLNKRRVYRGAWLETKQHISAPESSAPTPVSSRSPISGNPLSSSDAFLPDVPLRDVLMPPISHTPRASWDASLFHMGPEIHDLSVPASRFHKEDMERFWVDHETDESLSSVDHLCLIVHGIGEMLRSIDVFGLSLPNLASIVDCCAFLRQNHAAVQQAHLQQLYPAAYTEISSTRGRVEYLPVEWHEAFAVLSQRRSLPSAPKTGRPPVLMQDISLRTIPNMRDFANDTLMDVLYFMSPEHHDRMIEIVTNEMNTVVHKFKDLTGFRGRISVLGHSLGSVIAFDILANQNLDLYVGDQEGFIQGVASETSLESFQSARSFEQTGHGASSQGGVELEPERSVPLDEVHSPRRLSKSSHDFVYRELDFEVDNFFMLGSPVPVFLMIRNQQRPLQEDYYLRGCHRVFNIFHPYDPVAYRIEPCLDPRNADFEPTIMPHWNGGFRIQYQSKRLWRKLVDTTYRTQQNVAEAFEASMAGMGLLDTTREVPVDADNNDEEDEASESSTSEFSEIRLPYVVTGQLNQGRRLDYMLQEREIEHANEYVAALAAHSSYWVEKDLSLFIARQIALSCIERDDQYAYDEDDME